MASINGKAPPKRISRRQLVGLSVVMLAVLVLASAAILVGRRNNITPPPTAEVFLRSPAAATTAPAALPAIARVGQGPSFAVLGDSYAAAQGASDQTKGWVELVARGMCWNLVKNAAQGGTGYTVAGSRPGTSPFADRVQSVIDTKPNILFVEGGGNDNEASSEELYNAATNVFEKLQDGLGDTTQIIAIGPIQTPKKPPDELLRTSQALVSAAADNGVTFIDPFGESWMVDPAYFVEDQSHLNDAGYAQYANRLIDDLRRLTLSMPGVGCPPSA